MIRRSENGLVGRVEVVQVGVVELVAAAVVKMLVAAHLALLSQQPRSLAGIILTFRPGLVVNLL